MKYQQLIDQLTLEEKVSLTSGSDFWQSVSIERDGNTLIPSMFLADGPHGIRKQAAASDHLGLNPSIPATCFPTAASMACTWNDELGEQMGEMLGEEAVDEKVNVLLGPGTNIKRNPRCGRNFEYFSEDPLLAGKMAASYIRGIQKNGISACVKHFALNDQEERRMVIDTIVDERTMREIYLKPFEIAVKEGGTKAIMSSYNMINGSHANDNIHVLRDILRDDWGYEGVVVTDWGGCNDRVQGLIAGNELEMPSCRYSNDDLLKAIREGYEIPPELTPDRPGGQYERVMAALKDGKLDEKYLDEALDRLLDLIFTTEKAFEGRGLSDKLAVRNVDAHHDMARRCAEEAIVLLKNDGVLPLSKGTKVAVIGDFAKVPRYQGAGSSVVNPTKLDSPLALLGFEIKKYAKEPTVPHAKDRIGAAVKENEFGFDVAGYEQGFDRYGKKNSGLIKKACALAEKADVLLCYVGLDEVTEAEGLDRENLAIPAVQLELLSELKKTGKKMVVILACGAAVELPFADDADAIVHSNLGGQAIAKAVLDVISGKINPSGKLAESYPFKYEDCSSASNFPGKAVSVEYREGPFVGYRYYTSANVPVRYPFGYGLSYTEYEYSNLAVDEKGVNFRISNTGSFDGKETAQLYIGLPGSKIIRPVIELRGFKKVFVKAGGTVDVRIDFDGNAFKFFNVLTGKWETEGGKYAVYVGASSEDIRLTGEIEVKGTAEVLPYSCSALECYFRADVSNVGDAAFSALLGEGLEKYRYPIPDRNYKFYKKNRMVIGYNSTVSDLRYSKRWFGRFFSSVMRFTVKLMSAFGNKATANTVAMGVIHQPMRGMAKFAGMNKAQLDGLILMCNGHFWKGLGQVMSGKTKEQKKKEKEAKKAAAEGKK